MRERDIKTAKYYNLLEQCEALDRDLSKIAYATSVEIDTENWSDCKQVILLVGYKFPDINEYYNNRNTFIRDILLTASKHKLQLTADRIEDYGAHLYFVTEPTNKEYWSAKGEKK